MTSVKSLDRKNEQRENDVGLSQVVKVHPLQITSFEISCYRNDMSSIYGWLKRTLMLQRCTARSVCVGKYPAVKIKSFDPQRCGFVCAYTSQAAATLVTRLVRLGEVMWGLGTGIGSGPHRLFLLSIVVYSLHLNAHDEWKPSNCLKGVTR